MMIRLPGISRRVPGPKRQGIVQRVYVEDGAVATGTTVLPRDDTIPQNTEGDEYITATIVPKNANNRLRIHAVIHGSHSAVADPQIALFKDSESGARAVSTFGGASAAQAVSTMLQYEMAAGGVASTTFKIRAGGSTGATFTFNGVTGGRLFGGVFLSTIVIEEITP